MRDAATSENGLSLLAGLATFACHGHDVVTAERTSCVPSDLITEAFLDD